MADGTSMSKLVIDVEVNDRNAKLALASLKNSIKDFNSSGSGKAVSQMATNMNKVTQNTAQARREAGQFIEQIKKNNKNLMPADLYGKSMQKYQKELASAQNKMKAIMSSSAPDKQLKGLERYTIQATMARNAIEALGKAQQKQSSTGLKNFWETDAWKNGTFKSGNHKSSGVINNEQRPISSATKGLASFRDNIGSATANFQRSVDLSGFKDFQATVLKAGQSYSKPYIELEKQIRKCETRLENLYTKQELMKNAKPGTERYQKLQTDIKKAEMELDGLNSKMSQLQSSGGDVVKNNPFSKMFSGLSKKSYSAFSSMKKSISSIGKELEKIPNKLMKPLLRLGTMFRAMILRRFIMQIFKSMKDAVDNLAKYSNTIGSDFNKSISTIVSDFKYLGRVIITAFEPLINFAAPVLDFIVQKIVAAINMINQFLNAVMGNSSWTKASYNVDNYADSLDSATGSAKKLKQQLQGFDELNNLTTNDGGSGSGGGSGTNANDMFTTEQVSAQAKGWAEKFKESWANADFTDLGKEISAKITSALNGVNWDGIKETANKIAKSLATFLNGFINPDLFGAVGTTIAQALNTAIGSVKTFSDNFDWSNFGTSIASSINKFFKTFDFVKAGMTLTSLASGLLTCVTDAVAKVDWDVVGEKIADFFISIDWNKLVGQSALLIAGLLSGITQMIYGAMAKLVEKAGETFKSQALSVIAKIVEVMCGEEAGKKVFEVGTSIVDGISKGIAENLRTSATWVKEHFQKLVDAVKNFFGIHSPSTLFAEIGGYLIEGLKKGILDSINAIGTWVTTTFAKITNAVKSFFSTEAPKNGTSFIDGLKAGITNAMKSIPDFIKKNVVEVIQKAMSKIKDIKAKITVTGLDALDKVKNTWNGIKKGTKKLKTSFSSTGQKTLENIVKLWDKIKEGGKKISVTFSDFFSAPIKKVFNGLVYSINKSIAVINKIPGVNINELKTIAKGGSFHNGSWHNISQYANGGMVNHGSMFVAGEAGPEIVGHVGGRTEVLNQSQLASTMYSAVLSAMQQANGSGSQPIQVYLDGKVVFDNTRQYANDYTRRTGLPAF